MSLVPIFKSIALALLLVTFVVIAQVAPEVRSLKFTVWESNAITTDTKVIKIYNEESILRCSLLCLNSPQCIGANLDISLMTCQLRGKENEGTGQIFITNSTSQTALIVDGIAVVEYAKTWKNFRASDCYTGRSHEYSGTTSTTISGYTCQRWNESYPQTIEYLPLVESDRSTNYCRASAVDESPWCYTISLDNPEKWEYCSVIPCFSCGVMDNLPPFPPNTTAVVSVREIPIVSFQCETLQPGTSQTHCPVSRCLDNEWTKNYTMSCAAEDCYTSSQDYTGKVACTVSGIPCQAWNTNTPHQPSDVPSDAESLDSNFCRDLGASGAPWCYTMDSNRRWDFCPVPKC